MAAGGAALVVRWWLTAVAVSTVAWGAAQENSSDLPHLKAAGSPYEIGQAIGSTFSKQLHTFIEQYDTLRRVLLPYYGSAAGRQVCDEFLATVALHYPDYLQEIHGIANGSGVPFETVWLLNIREEVELLVESNQTTTTAPAACSDLHVKTEDMVMFGHNEDNSPSIGPGAFLLTAQPTGGYPGYTAYNYPGVLSGNAFGFNAHGLAFSCNALFPVDIVVAGVPRQILGRDTMNARTIEEVVDRLTKLPSACGFSLNIGSLHTGELVNIEVTPGSRKINVLNITTQAFHFNNYVRMATPAHTDVSSVHRLARLQQLGEPNTAHGILGVLGDTGDKAYPIYRTGNAPDDGKTLASVLFDLRVGNATIWVNANPHTATPWATLPLHAN
eukprot:m.68270 g.68270  ORF g.68270 m.68270 type:complete len:386 (+) comp13891_c0_seq2:58-1215(+)